jgi:hypothetical protein
VSGASNTVDTVVTVRDRSAASNGSRAENTVIKVWNPIRRRGITGPSVS